MTKKLSRLLAVLLVVSMVFALVACTKGGNTPTGTQATDPTSTPEVPELVKYLDQMDLGELEAVLGDAESGSVSYDVYPGVEGKDYTDPAVYTFNDTLASTTGLNWGPLTWETNEDSGILDLTTTGLYNFAVNSTLDGWAITMEMATEPAADVTADFVGQYGIAEGETGKAFKFKLAEGACFDDGTPINADTYLYSYKELLDPIMKNRRADSLYAGELAVYNAKNYFYAGGAAATLLSEMGYTSVAEYLADGGAMEDLYVDCYNFWGAAGYDDADGNVVDQWVNALDETVYGESVEDPFSGAELMSYFVEGADYESYGPDYVAVIQKTEAVTWDEVGIVKTGDYEIVFIFTAPVAQPEYYIPYNFSSTYLVHPTMWESCKSYFDADGNPVKAGSPDVASITTNYCTTLETSVSYGPYKLSYFELDKSIKLVRNDNWFGYSDGKHTGRYQMDNYNISIIVEHETELLSFLNGEIDSVSLQSQDMEKYGHSDYIRYEPQSYTTKLSFNTNPESLAEHGSSVLTSLNFRKAFALSIDRNTFASSYTSAGSAGYGLLNYLYVYDPFTGATYRDTDSAKAALCDVYGLTWGEGGDFDSLDEAYDAITGYDLTTARELMQQAYEELKGAGLYNDEAVTLDMRVYNSDDIYVQMFNFLNDALAAACVGTGFEGKVAMTMTPDADYYETMYSGGCDIIFTTWGGAAYSPYTMLYECYCDAADGSGNQMEYGFDTSAISVDITINGALYTQSLQDWALWCDSSPVTLTSVDGSAELAPFRSYDAATKAEIFSRLEYAYLSNFTTTPMYYRNVGFLMSQKGDYAVKENLDLIGFGGIMHYTFNYDDATWETVKNTLTY